MGAYQVIGKMTQDARNKVLNILHIKKTNIVYRFLQVVVTFLLISFAMLFFRSESLSLTIKYINRLFTHFDLKQFVAEGMIINIISTRNLIILIVSILILSVVDLIRKYKGVMLDEYLYSKAFPVRLVVVMGLLFYVLIFGIYGVNVFSKPFIYFQF